MENIDILELKVELGKKRKEKIKIIDDCIEVLKGYKDIVNQAYNEQYDRLK